MGLLELKLNYYQGAQNLISQTERENNIDVGTVHEQ